MYHFQVLPLHPRIQTLETLTSYMQRLADDNGLRSVDAISALLFPHQSRRIIRTLADFPPLNLVTMAEATACSETALRQTTFYHLGRKFSRSTHPQALSRFPKQSLAENLRYCPECLRQNLHYVLPWRFLDLKGCPHHGGQLWDICGHCGGPIPLFRAPLRPGICPFCQHDLRDVQTTPLTESEQRLAERTYRMLEYLLKPQDWEADSSQRIRVVGQQLARLRQTHNMAGADLAAALGLTHSVVEGIERGNVVSRGGTFRDYCRYAAFVSVNLVDLVSYS